VKHGKSMPMKHDVCVKGGGGYRQHMSGAQGVMDEVVQIIDAVWFDS